MTMTRSKKRLSGNLALVALVLSFVVLIAASSGPATIRTAEARPNATTITLSPSPATIAGCDTVQVQVLLNDVVDLYGADIRLAFDPAALEVVDANPGKTGIQIMNGGFLVSPWILFDTADNTAGTIRFVATQLNPTPPANGTGVLVNILFRAKSSGTTPLTLTFTHLTDRNGQTIAATASNGTAISTGPTVPTVSIGKLNATDAWLSWTATAGTAGYLIYRDTTPYFTPADPPYGTTTGLSYDDAGALGNTSTNYYYVVKSTCANGLQSDNSNRVGEYDFPLRAVSPTNYNDAAVVLENPAFADAASLATYIGASARRILVYDASTQTLQTYIVGVPTTNFSLAIGKFVYVLTNNTAPSSFALVGRVPAPGSVTFALVSGTPAKYNFMSVPLEREDLGTASAVAASFVTGVSRVIRYQIDTQSFQSYTPGVSTTDFALVVGEPFGVRLSTGASSNWP